MSQAEPNNRKSGAGGTQARRPWPLGVVLLLAAVAIAAVIFWPEPKTPPTPPSVSTSAAPSAPVADTAADKSYFHKLPGRWLRPDGGYVIDIRKVEPAGKLEAFYFNPRQIHVAQAKATAEGGRTRVFLELRDTGYPGCTYTLDYNPEKDVLAGVYYQASMDQEFEVFFVRMEE